MTQHRHTMIRCLVAVCVPSLWRSGPGLSPSFARHTPGARRPIVKAPRKAGGDVPLQDAVEQQNPQEDAEKADLEEGQSAVKLATDILKSHDDASQLAKAFEYFTEDDLKEASRDSLSLALEDVETNARRRKTLVGILYDGLRKSAPVAATSMPQVQRKNTFKEWLQSSPKAPAMLECDTLNALYWELDRRLTAPIGRRSDYMRFVGISGGGKTRAMLEECVHGSNDGIYCTLSKARNGGSSAAERILARVVAEGLTGDVACSLFMGMFLSHVKFYLEYSGSKLDRMFLMTQNCGDMVEKHALDMPTPRDATEAQEWMEAMRDCVVQYGAKPRLMIDEVQTVRDPDLLRELIRAVDKLVGMAVVTGTGVNKRILKAATKDRQSGVGKGQWEDVPAPKLLKWSECEAYMDRHAPGVSDWLKGRPEYQQWFSPTRARILALAVQRLQSVAKPEYERVLDDLYAELCDSENDMYMLRSNFGRNVEQNIEVVSPTVGQTYARLLAEYIVFQEMSADYRDPELEDLVCTANGVVGREVLVMECLKRLEPVVKLWPTVIQRAIRSSNPSSAGFLFEYPVAYTIAGVVNLEDLTFLHQSLADALPELAKQRDGWFAVLPDMYARPDIVLFLMENKRVSQLKVVQAKRWKNPIGGKALQDALASTDLENVYTSKKTGKAVRTRQSERNRIIAWFRELQRAGVVQVERVLVCPQGAAQGEQTAGVRVVSKAGDPDASFCGTALWAE